jgi:hypothetical protein
VGANVPPTEGYQSVEVVDVAVEVGQGSPLPVFVEVGANLPDTCAQVELVEVLQDETFFSIYVGTIPSTDPACLKDAVPFRMRIPLSVVGLPAGSYDVQVNSVPAEFQLETGHAEADRPTREMPIERRDLLVDDIRIEVGQGSPLPVHAVVSANLPNACSQLGEIRLHRDPLMNAFYVRLIAYVPTQADCSPDTLPLRVEIPLNIIALPAGTYEVNVNGMTATTLELPVK